MPSDLWTKSLYNRGMLGAGTPQPAPSQAQLDEEYRNMVQFLNPSTYSPANPAPAASTPTLRNVTQAIQPVTQYYGMSRVLPESLSSSSSLDFPTYTAPKYDTGRIESLAQRTAAPGIRNLRSQVQATQQGYYENPNVKAQTLRDALAGYGQGLESVMAGALATSTNMYNQEYGTKQQEEMTNYQSKFQKAMSRYQADLQSELLGQKGNIESNLLAQRASYLQ